MQNIIVSSSHDEISMATVPPISSTDSKESSDPNISASKHEVITDLKEKEKCASNDEQPHIHSKAY